jgi:hypothetical protein
MIFSNKCTGKYLTVLYSRLLGRCSRRAAGRGQRCEQSREPAGRDAATRPTPVSCTCPYEHSITDLVLLRMVRYTFVWTDWLLHLHKAQNNFYTICAGMIVSFRPQCPFTLTWVCRDSGYSVCRRVPGLVESPGTTAPAPSRPCKCSARTRSTLHTTRTL